MKPAAGAFTLLHCNRSQPGKAQATTSDLGTAFLRFKAGANSRRGLLR
jgi:hypothetical protein